MNKELLETDIIIKGQQIMKSCLSFISEVIKTKNITTKFIDTEVNNILEKNNAVSSPKSEYNFPSYTCISVNHVACHGVADDYILKHGDIVTFDVSFKITENNITQHFDSADTHVIIYDEITSKDQEKIDLVEYTKQVFYKCIDIANDRLEKTKSIYYSSFGCIYYDIVDKNKYVISADLGGHVIGRKLHQRPFINSTNLYNNESHIEIPDNVIFCFEPIIGVRNDTTHDSRQYMETKHNGHNIINVSGNYVGHFERMLYRSNNKIKFLT